MGLIVVSGLTHVGMGFTAGRGVILSQVLGGFWVMALFALYTSVSIAACRRLYSCPENNIKAKLLKITMRN
jgi:hypothetical protein